MSVLRSPQPMRRPGHKQWRQGRFSRLRRPQAAGTPFLHHSPQRDMHTGLPECSAGCPMLALADLSSRAVWPMCAQSWTGWLRLRGCELSKRAESPVAKAQNVCFKRHIARKLSLPCGKLSLHSSASDPSVWRHLLGMASPHRAQINTQSPKARRFAGGQRHPGRCGFPRQGTMAG